MNPSDPTESRIRSLATKRAIQMMFVPFIAIPFVAIILVWKIPDLWVFNFPEEYLFVGGFGVIFSCFFLTFLNWRCPECGAYLGREFHPRTCRRCGLTFSEGTGDASVRP
jgi:rubredoxin